MNIRKEIYKLLNIGIVKRFPRHSVRFAKQYFNGKEITVIEVGTFWGYNAKSILSELNIKKIYLVDPYKFYSGKDGKDEGLLSKARKFAHNKLNNYINKIYWIEKKSDEATHILPKVNFIYIDGDHSKEQVKRDMENYFKLLKKGGVMGGHDITSPYGVQEAFVEFCYENKLKPHITRTDWWVVKE